VKRATAAALALVLVLAHSTAFAADPPFSQRGAWAVGIDHLAGVVRLEHLAEGMTPSREDVKQTHVGLLGGSLVPRLSVHRFVDAFSLGLGGQIAVARFGGEAVTTWGVAPRVGLVVPFGASTSLWLRTGVTYLRSSAIGTERRAWSLAVAGEAQFVFSFHSSVSLVIGPFLESGLGGTESFEPLTHTDPEGNLVVESEASVRTRTYGVSLGAFIDF